MLPIYGKAAEMLNCHPGDIYEKLGDPKWENAGEVHDWRNYVPKSAIECWEQLPLEARVVTFIMAESLASSEEWE